MKQTMGKSDEIFSVIRYLQNNDIKCFKYNSTFDSQGSPSFQSLLTLSEDSNKLVITNR